LTGILRNGSDFSVNHDWREKPNERGLIFFAFPALGVGMKEVFWAERERPELNGPGKLSGASCACSRDFGIPAERLDGRSAGSEVSRLTSSGQGG